MARKMDVSGDMDVVTEDLQLLTMADIIRLTGLHESTVYKHVGAGKFPPPLKVGGSNRWPASELRAYVADLAAKRSPRTRRAA